MPNPRSVLLVLPLGLLMLALVRFGTLQAGGPAHLDGALADGTPTTLYLPYGEGARWVEVPPRAERPPAVLVLHGYASDRANVSALSRSLARAGYAALAVDLPGHGRNEAASFELASGNPDRPFQATIEAAVHFLRVSGHVDGSRLALIGHSMGAHASLAYASWDPAIDAVVAISGGRARPGPHRPPNVLFLYAEGDPERVHRNAADRAAELAGSQSLEPERVTGDFARGTAVSHAAIPGSDHASVVVFDETVERSIAWLDQAFGFERGVDAGMDDPRLFWAGVGVLAFALSLPVLGFALARIAPETGPDTAVASWSDLAWLAGWLVLGLPLLAANASWPWMGVEIIDLVVPYLALASLGFLVQQGLGAALPLGAWSRGLPRSALAALLGVALVYALLSPFGDAFHALRLGPQRAWAALVCALGLLPLSLAFELVLRRGSVTLGVVRSLAGKLLLVVTLALGIALGIVPSVVAFMLAAFAFLFVLTEILCAALRAGGGSATAAALLQAGWIGWVFAAVMPLS